MARIHSGTPSATNCANRARATRDLGVPVVVVARPGSLSGELVGEGFGIRLLAAPAPRDDVTLAV